jgi:hypothetical protein
LLLEDHPDCKVICRSLCLVDMALATQNHEQLGMHLPIMNIHIQNEISLLTVSYFKLIEQSEMN